MPKVTIVVSATVSFQLLNFFQKFIQLLNYFFKKNNSIKYPDLFLKNHLSNLNLQHCCEWLEGFSTLECVFEGRLFHVV